MNDAGFYNDAPQPPAGSIHAAVATVKAQAAERAKDNYKGPSSRALLDVITADESDGLTRGKLTYLNTKASAYGVPLEAGRFTKELQSSLRTTEKATPFAHPRSGARPTIAQHSGGDESAGLAPSDIAWLNGLPTDPEQVSFTDAQHLASLAHKMSALHAHDGDRRLIEQRWAPVEEVYDRREAAHELTQASKPLTQLPNPVTAVAAILGIEMPGLAESELLAIAEQRVDAAFEARQTRHTNRLTYAQQRMTEINDRKAQRTSTTKRP